MVALVNAEDSPLARAANHAIPLRAGTETSVAATKSYIASLSAIVQLVGSWTQDDELQDALDGVPDQLAARLAARLGRGDRAASNRPIACSSSDAGSVSASPRRPRSSSRKPAACTPRHSVRRNCATVRWRWWAADFRCSRSRNTTRRGADVEALAGELAGVGASVLLAGSQVPGVLALPALRAHPAIEPLLLIQSFYRLATRSPSARGRDPDRPPHLRKVTETV